MTCQLPADCLDEIFEYLEEDKSSLHSCLLVNSLWYKTAVRPLWRDIWLQYHVPRMPFQSLTSLAILSTLVACLPNESRDFLRTNGISIPTPTSKPPLLNYISFIKVLSMCGINQMIEDSLSQQPNFPQNFVHNKYLVLQELLKTFMCRIPSLKSLNYGFVTSAPMIPFTHFPEAKDCLTDLSVLSCHSKIHSEFFFQLSQTCRNIQSLAIEIEDNISDGLKELISSQNRLRSLTLSDYGKDWVDIIPALTKHRDTLMTLHIHSDRDDLPLSFVGLFTSLQELIISSFGNKVSFEGFNELQHVAFSNLHVLKIPFECPRAGMLMKFLETNGRNLHELDIDGINKSLKSSVARYCPNLKRLSMIFGNDELDILKVIFDHCQRLESIKVWCSDYYLNEKELLNAVAKYSPKNFYELKILPSRLLSEDLESFFISWGNRIPRKPLTLITLYDDFSFGLDVYGGNITTIEKYKKLGILKKFENKYDNEYDL